MKKVRSYEITPENLYLSRRQFMMGVGTLAVGATTTAACGGWPALRPTAELSSAGAVPPIGGTDELGDSWNDFEAITHYNNYYEFTTDKEDVAPLSQSLRTRPWAISV